MDKSALFKITYGLFIAGVEQNGKLSACITNTAIQTTSEPATVSVTMLKSNLTTQLIAEKKSLALTILSKDTTLETIGAFGYRSSRDVDKFENLNYKTDKNGNPFIEDTMNAFMELEVEQTLDLGTHFMFLCKISDAKVLSDAESMSYADYRSLKSGGTIKKGDAKKEKKYICTVCHYVYDGDIPFEDLPDDYLCPVCNAPKSAFVAE